MHEESIFQQFALLLIIAAIAGTIATRLKQPVIIAYILVGIIVGPVGFALVTAHDQIELLAKIGVTVLLFLVGLKLDIQHVKHIGPVALATGLGQLLFTIVIGFFITLLLGKDWMTALYVAIALTFSSTIIVIKLLSDKRELDSLHGRIAIGFLIVQDVAVVIAMMFVSTLRDTGLDDTSILLEVAIIAAKLLAVAVVVFLLMRYVLPWLMRFVAQSQELLLVFAIAWGVALSSAGQLIGFSMEAGAFIAGFSLASTVYRDAISARLGGIRDFLLLFFFVELGSKLDFSSLSEELLSAIILSLFVLIGNPLIVMAIMGYMGYRKRTGFMAGLTVAQISEFSIIFVAMGITLGHVGQDALGLTTLVGIVTIAASTYMIIYSQNLYRWFSPYLGIFERRFAFRETETSRQNIHINEPSVLIVGLGRFGGQVLRQLHKQGIGVMGIDFNPEVVQKFREAGYNVLYGNTEDSELFSTVPFSQVAHILTTLPSDDANAALFHHLSLYNHQARITAVVRTETNLLHLKQMGISHTINPYIFAADHTAEMIAQEFTQQEVSS